MSAEINRKIQNLVSVGTVIDVNPADATMRLQIDENETDWLPIPTICAGVVSVWRCPSIGEQFQVSSQSGELSNGLPTISYFSENNPAPSKNKDEVVIQMGKEISFLFNIETGEATLKTKKLTVDAQETIFNGSIHATQNISSDQDVTAGSISLKNHKTTGVKGGSEISGNPQ